MKTLLPQTGVQLMSAELVVTDEEETFIGVEHFFVVFEREEEYPIVVLSLQKLATAKS